MKYENTVHLKNGTTITQGSDENLADKLSCKESWDKGALFLDSENKTVIPMNFIAFIDTSEVTE